ncbi:MAG: conjugal transfer protein TraX [Acidaminococcales bacterium]|nr:conjugal transfer protein TraX [Acidaminococcales bacterium]
MAADYGKRRWEIFTGGQLKLIGAALMVFDHLRQMFSAHGAPEWFYWLGRPAAPLFAFLCAEGFAHTHSRGKYTLRLLIGFEFMNAASNLLARAFPSHSVVLLNNIFETFLLAVVYMWLTDKLRREIAEKNYRKAFLSALLMLLAAAAGIAAFNLLLDPAALPSVPLWLKILLLRAIPNLAVTEGGFVFVLMTVLFYLFRAHRPWQILTLLLTGALCFCLGAEAQALMSFAAVFMLLYNGERGKAGKYFFYIFYPAHIYLFYLAAWYAK